MSELTLVELQRAQCLALSGAEHRIQGADLEFSLKLLPLWKLVPASDARASTELVREFRFANFYHTMAFVNALAFIAHQQDHHPDLSVHYNRVEVRFSTHDVGGLSRNDLICAARVDALSIA